MNRATVEKCYRLLHLTRRVDEEISKAALAGRIPNPIHLSIGQEAVSVGACLALEPDDAAFGTYRSHALYLAKGGNLKKMIAELRGKATGSAKGKGGSMHLIDTRAGMMGTSAIVGTGIAHAVGYAYALRYRGQPRVVANFFGDGAVDEGVFHESLNFAALKRLPVIFICENNRYAIRTHQRRRHSRPDIAARARSYGIPARRIEGNDVLKIYSAVKKARALVLKRGAGPQFLECLTYRWKEHLGPGDDFDLGYRSRREAAPWMKGDQLPRIAALLPDRLRQSIEAKVEREIAAAFRSAESSPYPPARELFTDLWA